MVKKIDINADLGEGVGNDEKIMPYLSSCNIACGGHYGTDITIRKTALLAKKYHVKAGAHPSFPDRDSFGRKVLTITKQALAESIFQQLLHFYAVCESEEIPVNHIKLHGALYNYAAIDAPTADAVVEAIITTTVRPYLYLPYGSILQKKAENLIPLKFEGFIDRRYTAKGRLVSRESPEAVIHDPEEAWNQLKMMAVGQQVGTIEGQVIPLIADTYCIHGDNPHAVPILRFIHQKMKISDLDLA